MDRREAKRLETMRRVQDVALGLFEERGFDAVSVEEIAAAADVGAASIYRNFGTKERLVLWDEYDPLLFEGVTRALASGAPPFQAMVDAVCAGLGQFYRAERARVLRRTDLAVRTPALRAMAHTDLEQLRLGLVRALTPAVADRFERELTAAVFVTLLDRAIERWRHDRARTPLATCIRRGAKLVAAMG